MTPVRPLLLPDEMASGYFGRVIRINGWRNIEDALSQLTAWATGIDPSPPNAAPLKVLAMVAGQDIQPFIARNTVLPLTLQLGLDAVHAVVTANFTLAFNMARRGGDRNRAFFCEACMEEDSNSDIAPYWRREHQIPGLNWCRMHRGPLMNTREYNCYFESCGQYFCHPRRILRTSWHAERVCPAINRYVEISLWLLENVFSLDARELSRTARARALEVGVSPNRWSQFPDSLGAFLRGHFDHQWLDGLLSDLSIFRSLVDPPWEGEIFSDQLCKLPVTYYAVVFAAMYPSANAAIEALLASSKRNGPEVADSRTAA